MSNTKQTTRAPKEMPKTKCRKCGSTRFTIVSMRLTLLKVPMWFENGKEAPQYDDTKAECSEGWNTIDLPPISHPVFMAVWS
ncbi:MAG: hypothetical protein ABIH23_36170 [bacterium]